MSRKADHIRLSLDAQQVANEAPYWQDIILRHDALPEVSWDALSLEVEQPCGHKGPALMVVGMTGGFDDAASINLAIARACADLDLPMGLGSMRPWFDDAQSQGYDLVPTVPGLRLYGNIGGTQLAQYHRQGRIGETVLHAVETLHLRAFCVHLNPAQELCQPEGDRDFTGVLDAIQSLVETCPVPVIVKETGAGISADVCRRLHRVGVRWVDVSGTGGTSWTHIENSRADQPMRSFDGWGIPTPAALLANRENNHVSLVGSGGIRTGLDAAKAIACGASMAGVGRPVLSAWQKGGEAAAKAWLQQCLREMQSTMLLCGAKNIKDLQRVPSMAVGRVQEWIRIVG